jgi:tRNA-uridine 2-sulfurtransferase
MSRILVAMSGGVDSSVAAARLMRQGHEVVGVTLHLWDYPDTESPKARCCAPEDIHDAAKVAAFLGFPHYAFDRRELFSRKVVEPFVDAYLEGVTPSPCVNCNQQVKFAELLRAADRLGCDRLATGHYARIVANDTRLELHRGADMSKDQSYFLYALTEATLARLAFPLGESTKAEVRAEALEWRLPGAKKGESQELCFVISGHHDKFIEERARERLRPGQILQPDGRSVGDHSGIHRFTIGQRKSLGVATGQRSYVTALDPATGDVMLGDKAELARDWAELSDVQLAPDLVTPCSVDCMVRYRGQLQPARLIEEQDQFRVEFSQPVAPVVPGQFAVFFHGARVVGGGKIRKAGRAVAQPAVEN